MPTNEKHIIFKVDITTGKILVNKLEEIWQAQSMNSGLKDPVYPINPALLIEKEPANKELFKRVLRFNKKRKNKWTSYELYHLALLVGLQKRSHIHISYLLGKSAASCRQMLYLMKKAGVLNQSRKELRQ